MSSCSILHQINKFPLRKAAKRALEIFDPIGKKKRKRVKDRNGDCTVNDAGGDLSCSSGTVGSDIVSGIDVDPNFSSSNSNSNRSEDQIDSETSPHPSDSGNDSGATVKPENESKLPGESGQLQPKVSKPIQVFVKHPVGKSTPTTEEVHFHVRGDIIKVKFTAHPYP